MQRHLEQLQQAAEREIEAAPSRREQILQRCQAEASSFVESRRQTKLTKNYEGLVWGEAVSGGMIALGAAFDWSILVYIGIASFMTCWANTWFKGGESYANPRLHSYIFGGTLILLALVFMNLPQKSYDPDSVWRVEHKRNSITYKTEVHSGVEMQARDQRRLQGMKKAGIFLLVIGGVVMLYRVGRDVKSSDNA